MLCSSPYPYGLLNLANVNAAVKDKTHQHLHHFVKIGKSKGIFITNPQKIQSLLSRFCHSGGYVAWMHVNCYKTCTCTSGNMSAFTWFECWSLWNKKFEFHWPCSLPRLVPFNFDQLNVLIAMLVYVYPKKFLIFLAVQIESTSNDWNSCNCSSHKTATVNLKVQN